MTAAGAAARASGHRAAHLPDGRLHLQDGPIDLVIAAFGQADAIEAAYTAADAAFAGVLAELVGELPLLRAPLGEVAPPLTGLVARRMRAACLPFSDRFITPMAAVAGAVADHVLAGMLAAVPALRRAYVNNGGDLALHLAEGEHLDIGVVRSLATARPEGFLRIAATRPSRGIATSGRGGRSFSLGIADAVTVLARSAAMADAAATVIANAVDCDDPAIVRRTARSLDPDSDLRDLQVTVAVGPLSAEQVSLALERGAARAEAFRAAGLIDAALLALAGEWRAVGPLPQLSPPSSR